MKEKNGYKYIETIGELKKYKDKVIVCEYEDLIWAFIFDSVDVNEDTREHEECDGIKLYGKHFVWLDDKRRKNAYIYSHVYHYCDVQKLVREPTEQELKFYKNIVRHKIIFGK